MVDFTCPTGVHFSIVEPNDTGKIAKLTLKHQYVPFPGVCVFGGFVGGVCVCWGCMFFVCVCV